MSARTQARFTAALLAACVVASATAGGRAAGRDVHGSPPEASRTGIASVYAHRLDGRLTASGERYDPDALTAAHASLPFGTQVRVTNVRNRRSVIVRINDRGPYVRNRIIDLTPRAATAIGFSTRGIGRVRLDIMGMAADAGGAN